MHTASITLLDLALANPADEERLLGWWRDAGYLLRERFGATGAELYVESRGRYIAAIAFPFPGAWHEIAESRAWLDLAASRPTLEIHVRHLRPWRLDGGSRHLSTTQLARLLEEREAGERDLVLLDTMPAASFAGGHLPGAVNLPVDAIDEKRAARRIGADKSRPVVVYCSGYQ